MRKHHRLNQGMGTDILQTTLKEHDITGGSIIVSVVLCEEVDCKLIPITLEEFIYIEKGETAQGGAMSFSIKDNDTGNIYWCIKTYLLSLSISDVNKLDKLKNYSIIKDI